MYVVIGAEHCRRQLSQWQFTHAWTGVSIRKLMDPHKQRPRIIGLLGNIPSFKALAGRVAVKYVSKVNTADNFVHIPLDKYIPMYYEFLSIPEGVSVATVIIDGVDVAPAGLVKRSSGTREPEGGPVDITVQCVLNG